MAAVPPGPTEVRPKKTSLLFFRKEVDELDELETVKSHFILSFFFFFFFYFFERILCDSIQK
jgi:hypothetical protein